jgi:hypothetical protein
MQSLAALIGQAVDTAAVRTLVAVEGLSASAEPDFENDPDPSARRHYLSSAAGGYQLTHLGGRITTAFLYVVGAGEFEPFRGALIEGLTAGSSRADVRARLGPPSRSGEAMGLPPLGRQGAWDRYDGDRLSVHFQYTADASERIRLVTLMTSDTVPGR